MKPIDVWDKNSFDDELLSILMQNSKLIKDYYETGTEIFLSYDLKENHPGSFGRPENPYAVDFLHLKESLTQQMQRREIRAYHYTRLTDREVHLLQCEGIHLSTVESLKTRVTALVDQHLINDDEAELIIKMSPLMGEQRKIRINQFWMVSHPTAADDDGVMLLLSHWGGESASFHLPDEKLKTSLAAIGRACIVEVSVPLALTRQAYSAAESVLATFGRSLGCIPDKACFDLYLTQSLSAEHVLLIHTDSEPNFHNMGKSYPKGFVDHGIGRWKELTGEDD